MYYILVMRCNSVPTHWNQWFVEFGAYDKSEVMEERRYNIDQGIKAADLKVIKCAAADQKTIDTIVNKLNNRSK